MIKYLSTSPEETELIGEKIAEHINESKIIAYQGDLGMGKTCLTRGIAKGIGYNGYVTSPTFAIINEYIGGRLTIYHFDMYRVNSWEDLYSSGFFDYIEMGGIVIVEWSENIENALPSDTVFIKIKKIGENSREITISGMSDMESDDN